MGARQAKGQRTPKPTTREQLLDARVRILELELAKVKDELGRIEAWGREVDHEVFRRAARRKARGAR